LLDSMNLTMYSSKEELIMKRLREHSRMTIILP
jgi:hypothetical protein